MLLLAALAWGGWRIVELPAFRVASVSVTGLSHVSRQEVVAKAAIDPQSNVWLLDRSGIERRIEAIPYVATANVSVRPPAAVELAIRERTIDGCVRDGSSETFTIDADRRVLENDCDPASSVEYDVRARLGATPGSFVSNPELIALQTDRRALASSSQAYRSLGHDAFGELQATLRDGIVVKFGDDGDLGRAELDRKERLVGPILAQLGTEERAVRAVDVRAAATPVVEFRPAEPVHPHALNKL